MNEFRKKKKRLVRQHLTLTFMCLFSLMGCLFSQSLNALWLLPIVFSYSGMLISTEEILCIENRLCHLAKTKWELSWKMFINTD
ncbi:MAG: hypothetical protein KQ78_01478 [Candidatus Izimaplasma bacterium HR2]|nr:MAG: hypothetical protein KQ78_01478 [Candidatus Izimaplasma bacterium HR2]